MTYPTRAFAAAWTALVKGPGRGALRLGGLLLLLAIVAGVAGTERFPQLMLATASIAAGGLGRRSVGDDRASGRAVLLLQQPVTPLAHYGARLLLSVALFAAGTAAAAIAGTLGGIPHAWVSAVGAFYWATLLLLITTALSAFAPRHGLELLLLLIFISALQVLIADSIGLPHVREVLQWTLVPIDAVFGTWDQWRAGNFTIRPAYAGQLLLQPLLWSTLLALRLRRADIGAADYQAG